MIHVRAVLAVSLLSSCINYEINATFPKGTDEDAADTAAPDATTDGTEETGGSDLDTATVPSDGDGTACSWGGWVRDDDCGGGWVGTGADGDVTLTTWSPVSTTLTADVVGTTLPLADTTGIRVDDELLLHDARTGRWANARVRALDPVVVAEAVSFSAGTVVQRVPHYRNVTVEGDVSGSRIVIRACGTLTVNGRLGADGGGWTGASATSGIPEVGTQGESEQGTGGAAQEANGTGGGGAADSTRYHADGGGGGHATAGGTGGDCGAPCLGTGGLGGAIIGEASLARLYLGGGGGSGYLDTDAGSGSLGGAGGAGGGLVYIVAATTEGPGTISADGAPGDDGVWFGNASPGGGGGGAGGTVWLHGPVYLNVSALGGAGGIGSEAGRYSTLGGAGGDGRIRIDGAFSGTASPERYPACPE